MDNTVENFVTLFNNQNTIKKAESSERAALDRSAYLRGKKDQSEKLDRKADVLYNTQREIDRYNMGYS